MSNLLFESLEINYCNLKCFRQVSRSLKTMRRFDDRIKKFQTLRNFENMDFFFLGGGCYDDRNIDDDADDDRNIDEDVDDSNTKINKKLSDTSNLSVVDLDL